MKKIFIFLFLLMLSSNISAQDAFEWDANEDTKDIVYETPSSKLYRKWYEDMGDNYTQFNSNGTFTMVGSFINSDYDITIKQVLSGTWKRVEKMDLHLQITNATASYDKSEVAKLPARRRDILQKLISKLNAAERKEFVGKKFVYSIWRLDDDCFMFTSGYNQKKSVCLSDKRRKEVKKELEEKQAREEAEKQAREAEEKEQLKNKVYDVVGEMPEYPGGPSAMFEYLSKNIKYPVVAEENGVQGRVIVTFIVECDGSISNAKVSKSLEPSLDKEALRLVKSMPHWIPGKQNGEPVRVKYTVPVTFRLQ